MFSYGGLHPWQYGSMLHHLNIKYIKIDEYWLIEGAPTSCREKVIMCGDLYKHTTFGKCEDLEDVCYSLSSYMGNILMNINFWHHMRFNMEKDMS